MRRSWAFGTAIFLVLLSACTRPPSVAPLLGQPFASIQGEQAELHDWMGGKATVFLALDPDCPITQLYAHDFQDFADRYAGRGVNVVGVYAGPFMHRQAAAAFAAGAGLRFPQVVDSNCVLSLALQARVTPECFVTNPAGEVVYRGAFDDRPVRQGRKKPEATKHYLAGALDAYLATGKPQPEVVAVGCIVECEE